MQTKGGGKHDILPVGRATATTLDCLWMMPRDPDADMCPGTEMVAVSTEECMAHQSLLRSADDFGERFHRPRGRARRIARCRRFGYHQPMEGVHGAEGKRPPN